MKNLYISDLDGTLLNKENKLSTFTKNKLNELIRKGVLFTISSARTPATITPIFEDVKLPLPVCCMNGACLYDISTHTYEKAWVINSNSMNQIIDVFKNNNLHGFFFHASKSDLFTLYTKPNNAYSVTFYEERKDLKDKHFILKNSYEEIKGNDICFVACLNEKEYVEKLAFLLKDIKDIKVCYYADHEKENLYFLEIYSRFAGKGNTLNFLADRINADKKIAFGDNLNDLELLKAADISFAVENAHPTIKSLASEVIGSNSTDSVIKKILDIEQL